jgi:hypothetical protein
MMKAVKILSVFAGLLIVFAFISPDKKLNKFVSKIWKGQEVSMTAIELPDSLKSDISQLNSIHSVNGELLGYACYTTAFGCRVGGCAAPTNNANVQSYETFDYMVVYDPSLKIIKVDIANYGGQYGYEICRAKWLAQFIGGNSGFKLERNIDGISGATVSAQFLIDDLNEVGETLTTVLNTACL